MTTSAPYAGQASNRGRGRGVRSSARGLPRQTYAGPPSYAQAYVQTSQHASHGRPRGGATAVVHTASTLQMHQNLPVWNNGSYSRPRENALTLQDIVPAEPTWRCEPCKQTFPTEGHLASHSRLHVVCPEPGCSLVGTRAVIEAHQADAHAKPLPGLASAGQQGQPTYSQALKLDDEEALFRLAAEKAAQRAGRAAPVMAIPGTRIVLATPEDIEIWRAERRKFWPSEKRLLEKSQQKEETKRMRLAPTLSIPVATDDLESNASSDDSEAHVNLEDLSDHESTDLPEELSTKAQTPDSALVDAAKADSPEKKRICKYWLQGACHHGDKCRYLHSKGQTHETKLTARKGRIETKQRPTRTSLSDKLVADAVSRDTTAILSVIRFLVNNNFLDNVEDPR